MQPLNILALFCEDIREEKNGIFTLVGILPDYVKISQPPNGTLVSSNASASHTALSKLSVYVRINFDPDHDLGEPRIRLSTPGDQVIDLGVIGIDVMNRARTEAKERGNLQAGIIARSDIANFHIQKTGMMKVEVMLDDVPHLAGALNFRSEAEQELITPVGPQQYT